MRNITAGTVFLLASCLYVSFAFAQDGDKSQDVFPLPEVIVTGKQKPAPATVIVREATTQDIESYNAHTAGEVLTQVPGVNVQYGASSGEARAWIRGYRDRDTLILFDGIPIASPFEGTIDLNEIATNNVARIKVMKGAPSVIYGTNGMAGVIDIIPETGYRENHASGLVELGSNNRRYFRANAGGSFKQLNFNLSGSYESSGDYGLSDDFSARLNQPAGDRVNSDFLRKNLFIQLHSEQTPLGDTFFFYNFSDDNRGFTPQAGVADPDYERLLESKRQTLGLSNNFSSIPLTVKLFYSRNDSELATYTDETYRVVDELETSEDYSYGGMAYSVITFTGNYRLVLNAAMKDDVYMADNAFKDSDRAELITYNLAVENQFTLLDDRLSIAAGAIFTYFDQTQIDTSSTAINPQIAVAYQVSDEVSLHASAAQRTRFPKLRELYDRRRGNTGLSEQSAETYEAGLEYLHNQGWTSDLTVFRSNMHDLIERPDRSSAYENLDDVVIDGIELSSGGWLGMNLFGRLSYAYISVDEELPGGGSRQLRSRPKHTLQADLRYTLPHGITMSFNGIYVRDLYDVDDDGKYLRIPEYFVANMKTSWQINDRFKTYIAVSNILDENYEQKLGYPREGRTFSFGVSVDL